MDSGTPFLALYAPLGIWYPTEYDLARCEETLGRSLTDTEIVWHFDPATNTYLDQFGASEWCCDAAYGGFYNRRLDFWLWLPRTVWVWSDADPTWRCVECP